MHPDLPKLLDVQKKDRELAALTGRAQAIAEERATLDVALERGRIELAAAERAEIEATRRRDEAEQTLETQRTQHERRQQRLEQERNPRVAAQLLADVELGRNILAQEESDWIRMADDVTARAVALTAATERLAAAEAEQAPARTALADRDTELAVQLDAARAARASTACCASATIASATRARRRSWCRCRTPPAQRVTR